MTLFCLVFCLYLRQEYALLVLTEITVQYCNVNLSGLLARFTGLLSISQSLNLGPTSTALDFTAVISFFCLFFRFEITERKSTKTCQMFGNLADTYQLCLNKFLLNYDTFGGLLFTRTECKRSYSLLYLCDRHYGVTRLPRYIADFANYSL